MRKIYSILPIEAESSHRVRVAAYARVSSNSEEQLVSLQAQKEHYTNYISMNTDWQFVDVYFDSGVSGTKLKNRTGLNRLIEDCEKGLIELIITKSISRFARNTVDCLNLVRKLLAYDVAVIFEKENIRTDEMDEELILSILAEFAEKESKSISDNKKWGIQKKFKDGTFIIAYPPYGYFNNNGLMKIVPHEAKIVKEIFDNILKGHSTKTIASMLNDRGILTKRNNKWTASTINGIIKNEKYTGDVIFQKTYSDENYTKKINRGQKDRYLIENHHEAIITKEIYQKVNQIIEQRRLEKGNMGEEKYSNRYCLSGKILCGECHSKFKRRTHTKAKGKEIAWCCKTHIENKSKCSMKYVEEDTIHHAFIVMINKLIFSKDFLLVPLKSRLKKISNVAISHQTEKLQYKLTTNQDKLYEIEKLYNQKYLDFESYSRIKNQILFEQEQFNKQKNQLINLEQTKKQSKKYLDELIGHIKNLDYLEKFDESLFTNVIDEIKILDRTRVIFILKCRLELEERLD